MSRRTDELPQNDHDPTDAAPDGRATDEPTTDGPPAAGPSPDAPAPGGPDRPAKTESGQPRSARSWEAVRHLLVRLHFYAGVLVAPFLLVAALTGLAYTFTPQLDQLVYGDQLRVEKVGDEPLPLAEQIAAARAAYPEGTTASVITPPDPEDTTRVVLSVPELDDKQRTVFVDPYTAEVRGELTTWSGSTPLTTWLDDLHRNLHLGDTGRLYSEVAASWLWVAVAGGLVLWLGRSRGRRARSARGVLLPDRAARGVRRTRSRHAAAGVWLALGLLFLSATGLTWSNYAGERFGRLLDAANGNAPALDTALPGAEAPAEDHSEHAEHGGSGQAKADAYPADFEAALAAARDAGLGGTVVITPPADAASAWVVAQNDNVWPVHYDRVAVDTSSGEITSRTRWADHPVLNKLSKLGVQGHMGVLFGVVNQIVLAAVAIGLTAVIVWGYRMWWQRRPTRADRPALAGKAPERGAWRRLPLPVLILGIPAVAALGWALPVLGVTLAGFLVVDVVAGALRRRRSA
ncbi:PepSY-associated TM helix domain-containing protein [Streptomyces sp. C11-1]|uniref:PepSY-associated TM helix domain-containing protein n=1 Tax=Streptomyces durocortorensis TaxID=2811104 RepID=A0ABY9VT65_9ACTN|nr:PepSY-associated TM helix domain-containing protein [Streptomyces durocortorensis]WNF25941.1 PepSY-associated TM helix domain-containing protein [Streptomyces durocortorensis]